MRLWHIVCGIVILKTDNLHPYWRLQRQSIIMKMFQTGRGNNSFFSAFTPASRRDLSYGPPQAPSAGIQGEKDLMWKGIVRIDIEQQDRLQGLAFSGLTEQWSRA